MCKRGDAFSLPVLIARVSLIALITQCPFGRESALNEMLKDQRICGSRSAGRARGLRILLARMLASNSVLSRPGGSSGEPEPDPIPNSAVKLPSANGSSSQDARE